jgi:hypothetical protein
LEELQWRLTEQGFLLRLATCCARIAGLFTRLVFAGLKGGVDRHLVAIEGPRKVGFVAGLL